MKKFVMAALIGSVLLVCDWSTGQAQQACLHRDGETAVHRDRRMEALRGVRLINSAIGIHDGFTRGPYPSWDLLASSPWLGTLRTDGGPMGRLARKMQWGTSEPLPGWSIHYIAGDDGYTFSLRDVRDPCGFSYVSDDRGVIVEGEAIEPRTRVIPTEGSD